MRRLRLTAILLGLGVAAGAAVLWRWPLLADPSAYRDRIAQFASTELGRQVRIGGPIRLALATGPVLVARDVAIADRGDGIAATVHALRLRLDLTDLLGLRLVPRSLVLDRPAVTLPWPLPRPAPPALPRGFSARLEDGAISLGGLRFTAVNAALQSDGDNGAFTAGGTAVLGGLPWHFNFLLGAPDATGAANLSLTLDGQGAAANTGASFRGRFAADGRLRGQLSLRGADLSRLLAGPATSFAAEGEVSVQNDTLAAPDLAVMLGPSAGRASVQFHAMPPLRLEAQLGLGRIELGAWVAALGKAGVPFEVRLGLRATEAAWRDRMLHDVSVSLTTGPTGMTLEQAQASLPGGTRLALHGRITGGAAPVLEGAVEATSADARAALGWWNAAAPAWLGETPATAALRARLRLSPSALGLSGIVAQLGTASAAGSLAFGWDSKDGVSKQGGSKDAGSKPSLAADLELDHVALPAGAGTWPALAALHQWLPETSLRLRLAHGSWRGLALSHATLEAVAGTGGITLRAASLDVATGHVEAGGAVAWDGALNGARLDVRAADANALLLSLPEAWRFLPQLFFGPSHFAVTAQGPANAVSLQALADLNDLRAEGEFHLDGAAGVTGTVTLRHPSAPNLLGELGVTGADRWLDHGSLALSARLAASPGHWAAPDFSLSAGVARLYGNAALDLTGAVPDLILALHADTLALPAVSAHSTTLLPVGWMRGWQGHLQIAASTVLADLQPIAQDLTASVQLAGGVLSAEPVAARARGGMLTGGIGLDSTQTPPLLAARLEARQVGLPDAASSLFPPGPVGGVADGQMALTAHGFSPAAWLASASGTAAVTLRETALPGIDLAQAAALLAARPAKLRPLLVAALSGGDTGKLDGAITAQLDQGALTLAAPDLQGAYGAMAVSGVLDLVDGSGELKYRVTPDAPHAAALGVTLAGPFAAMRRVVDVAPAMRGGKR